MMINEFEARTGIYPTTDLYRIIEEYYYEFDGDKDEFCKAYKENANDIAEEIRNKANIDSALFSKKQAAEINSLTVEVEKLNKQLDHELEWKPCELDGNVMQNDYERLKAAGNPWNEEAVKEWLNEDFGFERDKIKIYRSVPTYEVNRHGALRRIGEAERAPYYAATDWNYARFDCGLMSYELANGELRFFNH